MINPLDAAPDHRMRQVPTCATPCRKISCAIDGSTAGPKSRLDQYNALVSELNGQAPVSRQLEISLIGDGALQASEADATAERSRGSTLSRASSPSSWPADHRDD
jgi:hypothetical protein